MDFLDSIDLKRKEKKSTRVRSWYLYEQFKSLERNQLDAVQRLKDRSCQDRILRQELSERRARRKLYDQAHSETCLDNSTSDGKKTSASLSTDDFFESFCELQEDEGSDQEADQDTDSEDAYSQEDSQTEIRFVDELKNLDNIKDDQSVTESVNSVVQNYKFNENITEDLKDEVTLVKNSIAEEINYQFETVEENMQCLTKYSKLRGDDKISELDCSSCGEECLKAVSARASQDSDITLKTMWSKLVSFAYQVIQLNRGNCYYDYSSQFLTAVLACDVLRRGVSKMCNILQPYVSPIKFATDDSDSSVSSHKHNRIKSSTYKKLKKPIHAKIPRNSQKQKKPLSHEKYLSDEYWHNISKHSFGYKNIENHKSSEPWRSEAQFSTCKSGLSQKSSCSIWPTISGTSTCQCPCHVKVTNPMWKIGQYIDTILKDIDDCKRM